VSLNGSEEVATMATEVQVVIDCADPARLSQFWAEALHYVRQDPPQGFDTWQDFLRSQGMPEESWNDAGAIVDPDLKGPRIYFQRVPEPKIVKNRVHLDLNVGPGVSAPLDVRQRVVNQEVERLITAGATVLRPGSVEHDEYWVVLQDPEGNEFCVQ
jgi:hypothetical protein